MTHQIPEELISAYLDGELTSDEQLLVEEALRDDPQSQQLLEDLQTLHDRLQAIPRSEPSRDYTEQILRRAERAILTGTTEPNPGLLSDESPAGPTVTLPTGKTSPGNWKHVVWASTALAATLLLALLFRPHQPISHQLTDATQRQPDPIASADQPSATTADEEDDVSGMENQLAPDPATESEETTEGTSAGLATKLAGESIEPKNRPAASFGAAGAASSDLRPGADASNPEELFLFVNLTQREFDRQTVVRTLLQQQVPFGYDPASKDELPATVGRTNRALANALDGAAVADQEKRINLAARKRDQINAKEKESALAKEASVRAANTRVVTIEASPEELEELVLNLSNQYQVELAVENNVNGIGQQVAPNRQLDSPVNRQAVERIQALAIHNNRRRTAANIAPAPAGKPVAKGAVEVAEPDDAKDSQPTPATIRAAADSANKKQARQAETDSRDKISAPGRQQKPGTLRVVVVIEADPPLAAATPARKKSLKGWELYVWQQDGTTYFSLMVGTNRLKTAEEITKSAVKGVAAIQPQLDQLQKGELVFIHGRRLGTKAPAPPARQVTEYCEKIGLKTR